MKGVRLLVVAAIAVLVTTGCADGGTDPDESTEPTASSGTVSPTDLPSAPSLGDDAAGVIADVEVAACATEAPLEANGTVVNSADTERDLVVTVSWTTEQGDVLGRGIAVLENVAAGDTVDWSVTSDAEPEVGVECTTSARAGELQA